MATPVPTPTYAFSDDPVRGATHHREILDILAATLDRFTTWRLAPYVARTSRCLEVAAGAGSIATWLASRAGEVTATDVDTTLVATLAQHHPNLIVRQHRIDVDPVETDHYDLIHARLLLAHLPQRRELLGKLAAALAPGGVLVIDEVQPSWEWCVLDAPDPPEAQRLFTAYHRALMTALTAAGTDPTWGRQVHRAMRAHGLADIEVELWAKSWYGGEPGCMLPHLSTSQLGRRLIDAGMSEADLEAFRTLLTDPTLMMHGNLAVSTMGRRPR